MQNVLTKRWLILANPSSNKNTHNHFSILTDLEREVELGILHADDPHNSCLAFHRNIVDLKNYVTYPQVTHFMEVSERFQDVSRKHCT